MAKTMAERDVSTSPMTVAPGRCPSTSVNGYGCACATARLSLPSAMLGKLRPRYYGPYQVSKVINVVAVRLNVAPGARIHDVFHAGLLKRFNAQPLDSPPPLPPMHHGATVLVPEAAVKARC
jgi:hypothetical protein